MQWKAATQRDMMWQQCTTGVQQWWTAPYRLIPAVPTALQPDQAAVTGHVTWHSALSTPVSVHHTTIKPQPERQALT
jgi:hypothetical protein